MPSSSVVVAEIYSIFVRSEWAATIYCYNLFNHLFGKIAMRQRTKWFRTCYFSHRHKSNGHTINGIIFNGFCECAACVRALAYYYYYYYVNQCYWSYRAGIVKLQLVHAHRDIANQPTHMHHHYHNHHHTLTSYAMAGVPMSRIRWIGWYVNNCLCRSSHSISLLRYVSMELFSSAFTNTLTKSKSCIHHLNLSLSHSLLRAHARIHVERCTD